MNRTYRQHRPAPRNHHGHQHQAGPSPKLAAFLSGILESVRSGDLGRETARDAIKAWPAFLAPDHAAKAAAVRKLAGG